MKKIIYILLLFVISVLCFYTGCVETLDAGDLVPPNIIVTAPSTNDSIPYGKRQITYSAWDDLSFGFLEVYINNEFNGRYDLDKDGTTPDIYLIIDSLLINQKITFYVVAHDKAGNSTTSNVMTNIKVTENTDPPAQPTNIAATPLSGNLVALSWKDNAVNETGYQLFRRESGQSYSSNAYATIEKNIENYTDNNAPSSVTFYYKIRAYNPYGNSNFSEEVNSKGQGEIVSPTEFTATALSTSQIKLTWKDNSTSETSYLVYRKFSSDEYFGKIATLNPNTTEYTDKNLYLGTNYTYKIAAHKDSIDVWSEEIEITTLSENVIAPTNLSAVIDADSKKVILTWSYSGWDSTCIERKIEGESNFKQIGSVISVKKFDDTNLSMGAKNYYRARTRTSSGNYSAYSNEVSIDVPYFPPTAPSNLSISKVAGSNTQFLLEWKDNSLDEDGFTIYRKLSDASTYEAVLQMGGNSGTGTVRLSDNIPDASKMYLYYVVAFKNYTSGRSESAISNIVNTSGGASQYPRPTNFAAQKLNSSSIKLTWDYASRSDLMAFKIYKKKEAWGIYDSLVVSKDIREYTDAGLTTNTTYYYKIKAVGYNQESDPTDEVYAKTDP